MTEQNKQQNGKNVVKQIKQIKGFKNHDVLQQSYFVNAALVSLLKQSAGCLIFDHLGGFKKHL